MNHLFIFRFVLPFLSFLLVDSIFLSAQKTSDLYFWKVSSVDFGNAQLQLSTSPPGLSSFSDKALNGGVIDSVFFDAPVSKDAFLNFRIFDIRFWVHNTRHPQREYLLGFSNIATESDLYAIKIPETKSELSIAARTQQFSFLTGFRYLSRPKKRFSWFAGGIINAGVGVGSKTDIVERVPDSDSTFSTKEYTLFAHESRMISISAVGGMRLHLMGRMGLSFQIQPGFSFNRFDGSWINGRHRWGRVGLYVRLI